MLCPETNPIDFIPDHQFGFRKQHSTVHALLKSHNDISLNLRAKKCTVACSLDVEKAFDSVWREGLLYKIVQLNFPPHTFNILESFLSNRNFFVQIQGTKSNECACDSGVPQGSILGPHLYNIFLFDFPHVYSSYNGKSSTGLLYADDTIAYVSDPFPITATRVLEEHVQKINNFYKTWGININKNKSEFICFRNASGKGEEGVVRESRNLALRIEDCVVPLRNNIRYLGVYFNNLFKFNKHARIVLSKSRKVSNILMPLLRSSALQKRTKLLLYKTIVRPVMTYAFPVWFTISPTVANELEALERKIIRLCAGKNFESRTKRYSNSYIYGDTNVIPLIKYSLFLMKNTITRLSNIRNVLVAEIPTSQQDSTWGNEIYPSPVGVLRLGLETSPVDERCPYFIRSVPGHNRG